MTVAQAVNVALIAARVTRITLSTRSTWFALWTIAELVRKPTAAWAWWVSRSRCTVSAATTIVTAIVRLAAVSTVRRVRRATRRSPSSSGTGSAADSEISSGRRRGGERGR